MVGRQPLTHLENPSGYISPVMYPTVPAPVHGRTEQAVAGEVAAQPPNLPTAHAVPPQGIRFPGTQFYFPFGWRGVWPVGISYLGVSHG